MDVTLVKKIFVISDFHFGHDNVIVLIFDEKYPNM